jgi:hypothetical protein
MVMKCPSCGAENPDHATYCNLCLTSVGFEDAEYTHGKTKQGEGFTDKYPSSFDKDAPQPEPDPFEPRPEAPPVEIGQYGQKSGEQIAPTARVDSTPVDVGQYGSHSGHEPHEPPPLAKDYTVSRDKRGHKRKKR